MEMAATSTRSLLKLGEHSLDSVHSLKVPGTYPGTDDTWRLEHFKKHFKINVIELCYEELLFDLIGVDPSIANAIRRLLLAEVPTMAIEKVYIHNNTSIIQDEVLAHRLGLIPIFADPRQFTMLPPRRGDDKFPDLSPNHMLEFILKVKCTRNPRAPKSSQDPNELFLHSNVTTDDMKWSPIGNQAEMFSVHDIRPVLNDILIAKLRPGQELDLRIVCVKGVGSDHAKFSPVATASYRLLPHIKIPHPVVGSKGDKLASCFPVGVIKVIDINGECQAQVVNPRLDTCSREVLRHEDLKGCVELSRVKDHFIFSVESTGALPADVLVTEAVMLLIEKCTYFISAIDQLTS